MSAWCVLGTGLASLACSDPDPPQRQTAAYFAFTAAPGGGGCPLGRTFEIPVGAGLLAVLNGGNSSTDRALDEDPVRVDCSVISGGAGFSTSVSLQTEEISFFTATGDLTAGGQGTLSITFQDQGISLQQRDCTANVEVVQPGAVWVNDLLCTNMQDARQPGSSCRLTGGYIFENCAQ